MTALSNPWPTNGSCTIAIASGKGGTGKTTVAVSLALAVQDAGHTVQLLDADVEEPNSHLLLKPQWSTCEPVLVPTPQIDLDKCDGCGQCKEVCEFGALASFGAGAMVFTELCHCCGACIPACPRGAIREEGRPVGKIELGTAEGMAFGQGLLNVSEPRPGPVIDALKKHRAAGGVTILDCPPGTSCPVVEALRDVDFICLVGDGTPFGFHDVQLAFELTQRMGVPAGIIINRVGLGDDRLAEFARHRNVPILAEIPNDRQIATVQSKGELAYRQIPVFKALFAQLVEKLITAVAQTPDRT